MPKMELQVDLVHAIDQINLTLKQDGAPLGWIGLSAADMDALIERLATARAAMADAVPASLDPGSRIQSIADPAWQTPRSQPPTGFALALRHPGLGWISFLFPAGSAQGLMESISRHQSR